VKIFPIDERLRHSLVRMVNGMNEVSGLVSEANGIERSERDLFFDDLALLDEYVSCFSYDGEVSQRGRVPSCWNKNTIFENEDEAEKRFNRHYKQYEFEWDEVTEENEMLVV